MFRCSLSAADRPAPFGLAGGSPGALGRNTLMHADGRVEQLAGLCKLRAERGDMLRIETPGVARGGHAWTNQRPSELHSILIAKTVLPRAGFLSVQTDTSLARLRCFRKKLLCR